MTHEEKKKLRADLASRLYPKLLLHAYTNPSPISGTLDTQAPKIANTAIRYADLFIEQLEEKQDAEDAANSTAG